MESSVNPNVDQPVSDVTLNTVDGEVAVRRGTQPRIFGGDTLALQFQESSGLVPTYSAVSGFEPWDCPPASMKRRSPAKMRDVVSFILNRQENWHLYRSRDAGCDRGRTAPLCRASNPRRGCARTLYERAVHDEIYADDSAVLLGTFGSRMPTSLQSQK